MPFPQGSGERRVGGGPRQPAVRVAPRTPLVLRHWQVQAPSSRPPGRIGPGLIWNRSSARCVACSCKARASVLALVLVGSACAAAGPNDAPGVDRAAVRPADDGREEAEATGVLRAEPESGCLWLEQTDCQVGAQLLLDGNQYWMDFSTAPASVRDDGDVVARVGEQVEVGGRFAPRTASKAVLWRRLHSCDVSSASGGPVGAASHAPGSGIPRVLEVRWFAPHGRSTATSWCSPRRLRDEMSDRGVHEHERRQRDRDSTGAQHRGGCRPR